MDSANKVAVVTGSSKGIGQAIAIRLAKDGYLVYVTYFTDEVGGQSTVKEIEKKGGKALLHKLDVADEKSVANLMSTIEKESGHLDVLVNNAEKDVIKTMEDSTFDEWKMAFNTKVHGSWLCTKYAVPLLKKSDNANIIMLSSSADERPTPNMLSYAVATAALTSLTKALAVHLAPEIRVNAVMPGEVRTSNWQGMEKDDKLWQGFADRNPMKRVATVEDVADAVMPLINDPHRFLSGNFLFVNGGNHLK